MRLHVSVVRATHHRTDRSMRKTHLVRFGLEHLEDARMQFLEALQQAQRKLVGGSGTSYASSAFFMRPRKCYLTLWNRFAVKEWEQSMLCNRLHDFIKSGSRTPN